MESKITMSIVLYNTSDYLFRQVYDCIINSTVAITLYIIDNSPVPCIESSEYPDSEYIFNNKNIGYGAAHNIAMRKAIENGSDYHFVVNPDVIFNENVIEKIVGYMQMNPDVGQLMPRVEYPDGRLQYLCKLLPSPIDLIGRRFITPFFKKALKKRDQRFELRFTNYDKVMNVPYLSGCFMLFRVKALQNIGLFDERFFMYPEDIDITRRMHKKYRTIFLPNVTIIHNHARDSYYSLKMMFIHVVNVMRYFNKWGWFFDEERKEINRETLEQFKLGNEQ